MGYIYLVALAKCYIDRYKSFYIWIFSFIAEPHSDEPEIFFFPLQNEKAGGKHFRIDENVLSTPNEPFIYLL